MRWAVLLLGLVSCGGARPVGPIPPVDTAPTAARPAARNAHEVGTEAAAIARLADELEAKARALEPAVTGRLIDLANQAGGGMAGLEHRFKTRKSIERKIRQRLSRDPERRMDAVVIDDALRYTIRVDDEPAGHYDRTVRSVLRALEGDGHRVIRVKNYWPRGDNYSGVNSVLLGPNGLEWELQFHTSASLQAQKDGRPYYEEMRKVATPPDRKRELFDKLAAPWDSIAIPAGVLHPHSLHRTEKIIRRDPPQ